MTALAERRRLPEGGMRVVISHQWTLAPRSGPSHRSATPIDMPRPRLSILERARGQRPFLRADAPPGSHTSCHRTSVDMLRERPTLTLSAHVGVSAAVAAVHPVHTRHGEALVARTSKRLAARAAARQRQAKANEDQRQREHIELEHATEFEVARLRRDSAAATVVAHEVEMARKVDILLALGNPVTRVAELTGEPEAEIRRLRKLAENAGQDGHASARNATRDRRRRVAEANHTPPVATGAAPAKPDDERSTPPDSTVSTRLDPSSDSGGPGQQAELSSPPSPTGKA